MKAISRGNVVAVLSVGLMMGLSGVAQADEKTLERWDDMGRDFTVEDHPDCGEALAKVYVQGGLGAVGGPAGAVAGAGTGLPDVYLDCPQVEPWMQNGT